MRSASWFVSFLVVLAAAGAAAQDVVLFNAAAAGPDAWSWENAKVTQEGAELVIAENNKTEAYGDVYLSEPLPYLPNAVFDLDVAKVPFGVYTVQALAFKGQTVVLTADLAKDSTRVGRFALPLATAGLPPFTERIMLKIWVANEEGAAVRLRNLRYVVPAGADRVTLDWAVDADLHGEPENLTWTLTPEGGVISLATNQSYGSLLFTNEVAKPEAGVILVQTPLVLGGTLTIQLAVFDAAGLYLSSVDAIQRVGSGWHAADLAALNLPPEAKFWRFKVWLEGNPDAKATLSRFIVLKKPAAPPPTETAAEVFVEPPAEAPAEPPAEEAVPAEPASETP